MIYHDIHEAGTVIEWDEIVDFGRRQETYRGTVQGHEAKTYYITENNGSKTMVIDPYYKVHTDTELIYAHMDNVNIRVIGE